MIYIVFLLSSTLLTYFIKNYMIKHSIFSELNARSSHTVPTPHGGGCAVSITWFIALIYLFSNNRIESNLFYALFVGAFISMLSFLDDIYKLSVRLRIIVQSTVSIIGITFLGGLDILDLGFIEISNPIVSNIFALLLIVWFINLYNFLDGIDGYAGVEAIFLGLAGFILFGGDHFVVLIVSVLGFLFWNYKDAKIFMGDVGSTLLGYNIAIFTIYYSNTHPMNLWVWIILFGLFWFDATTTLVRRILNKEKLNEAHNKHAYQRMVQSGWSHFKVTNWSILINLVLFLIVYFIHNIFIAFVSSLILLLIVLKFVDTRRITK